MILDLFELLTIKKRNENPVPNVMHSAYIIISFLMVSQTAHRDFWCFLTPNLVLRISSYCVE